MCTCKCGRPVKGFEKSILDTLGDKKKSRLVLCPHCEWKQNKSHERFLKRVGIKVPEPVQPGDGSTPLPEGFLASLIVNGTRGGIQINNPITKKPRMKSSQFFAYSN